jgi:hypothetical protein
MIEITLTILGAYWLIAVGTCIWYNNRLMPKIEKQIINEDPVLKELGYMPFSCKVVGYSMILLMSPILFLQIVLDGARFLKYRWQLQRTVKKLKEILVTVKEQEPDHPDIPRMEKTIAHFESILTEEDPLED